MTKLLQISGITQEEFANRVLTALEGFSQSPIVKRKQSVVNKAMVQILHGGNNVGQNEHNLSQFFEEKNNPTTVCIAQESYRHESDEYEIVETYEGATEEEALHEIKSSVISCLADWIEEDIKSSKKEGKKVEDTLTLYATKITFLQEDCDFDQESREITDCHVELDRTELAREKRLEKLLFQHIPDEDMSAHYLLEKTIIENLLEQENKNPEHFSHAGVSDILEWALSLVNASELIDLIEEMTDNMVNVTIYTDYV